MSDKLSQRTRFEELRDRLAHAICSFALDHIATHWYRAMISGSIRYGLRAAVRDELAADSQERDRG